MQWFRNSKILKDSFGTQRAMALTLFGKPITGRCYTTYLWLVTVVLFFTHTAEGARFGFSESDYIGEEVVGTRTIQVQEVEGLQNSITVRVIPITFEQFVALRITLPPELENTNTIIDPAESIPGGQMDFSNDVQILTFMPSMSPQEQNITLNFTNDSINEAEEGFYLLLDRIGDVPLEDQPVTFIRGGIALVTIKDDDVAQVSFTQPSYMIPESPGGLTNIVMIGKEDMVEYELDLTVTVTFMLSQQVFGIDDVMVSQTAVNITLLPQDRVVPVPFTILDDSIVETNETFSITLSIPSDSVSGLEIGTVSNTMVTIIEDDVGEIGFNQTEYSVRESDGSVTVGITIFQPRSMLSLDVLAGLEIAVFPDSAEEDVDYQVPAAFDPLVIMDIFITTVSRTITILSDDLVEDNERLILELTLKPDFSTGTFAVTVPQTEIIIIDGDGALEIFIEALNPVTEGSNAMISCYSSPSSIGEIQIQVNEVEQTLPFQDDGDTRVFTFGPVSRNDEGTVFQCFIGALVTDTVTLVVLLFCREEVVTIAGVMYSWPETRSGQTAHIQCPTNPSAIVSRQCNENGEWQETKPCSQGECEAEVVNFLGEAAVYVWSETEAGTTAMIPCPFLNVSVSRVCSIQGEWLDFDADACGVLDEVLEMILNQTINNETIVAVIEQLSAAVSMSEVNPTDQGFENLGLISQVFENVAMFVNESSTAIQPAVVKGLVDTMDSLLQWEETVLVNDNSSVIVQSFEVVAALFAQQVPIDEPLEISNPDSDIVFVAERIILEDLQLFGRGFSFSENEANESSVTVGDSDNSPHALESQEVAAVNLPASLFQEITNRTDVGVFFAVYDVPSLFPVTQSVSNENTTRSTVVGSQILASTVGSSLNFGDLEQPVSISLRLVQQEKMFQAQDSEVCVSWDFDLGEWTTEGCATIQVNDEIFLCECTHLTNFAVLVDICSRSEDCGEGPVDDILSYITYIGVAVSLVGLVLTVITLLIFKKLRDKYNSKFHIQLCIALFCMLLVFVVGVEQTEVYGGCVTVSVLIHYFTLVAVMWMGAEALLLFQKLVTSVFTKITTKYIVIVSLVCWFLPIVPVMVPLIIDLATGGDHNNDIIVRRNVFCFLNHIGAFWGAFLGPIFIVLIFNVVIFVIVVFVLMKHTMGSLRQQSEQMKVGTVCRLMVSISGVMFLFGLSWLFAALTITVQEVRVVAQALFTVFNSLQGFFIFIFFCVFSKEARESWKELLSCGKYKSEFLHPSHHKPASSNMLKRQVRTATRTTSVPSATLETSEYPQSSDAFPCEMIVNSYASESPDLIMHDPESDITTEKGLPDFGPEPQFVLAVETDGHTVKAGKEMVNNAAESNMTTPLKMRVTRTSTRKQHKHHVETTEVDFFTIHTTEGSDEEMTVEL